MAKNPDVVSAAQTGTERKDGVRSTARRIAGSKQFRALRDDIRNGQVVVFVGPSVPRAAGLGGAEDITAALAERIAHRLGILRDCREVDRLRHMGIEALAKLFAHHFGTAQLKQAIMEAQLGKAHLEEDDQLGLHTKILTIPFSMIVSTEWDDLFEEAGRRMDPPVYPASIATGQELLGLADTPKPVLIRPLGSIRMGDSIMTRQMAAVKGPGSTALPSFLASLFVTNHVLFLGYGVTDPVLLHYQWLFESEYGDQARRIWTRSYFFEPGLTKAGADWLEQLGLRVLDPGTNLSNSDEEEREFREQELLRLFLEELLAETRLDVTRILRTKRIVDFLAESEHLGKDMRIRARTGPIGQLTEEDLSQLSRQRGEVIRGPYSPQDAEYVYQKQLKEQFAVALERTVRSGHLAKFLLSANIESIQLRTAHQKWLELRLRHLVEFFESGMGASESILVVDRKGTYETQQYILGNKELAESRRVSAADSTYHLARTTKDPGEVKTAVDLFDLCFQAVALDNFQTLLEQSDDEGRTFLIDTLGKAIVDNKLESVLMPQSPEEDALAVRFRQQLRTNNHLTRKDVETLVGTSPPHAVLSVVADRIVYEAIKLHLIGQWREELETLRKDRPNWRIEVTDSNGKPKGTLEKDVYHQLIARSKDPDLYNLHAAGFVLTSDAQRVILRKRQDGMASPLFDPGKWDRTVHGHVRHGVHFSQEFLSELMEHFSDCNVHACEFVAQEQFVNICRQRRNETDFHPPRHAPIFTLQLRRDPIVDTYERWRPGYSQPIEEPVRTMLYVCLMPTAELPKRRDDKHYADWIEIPLDDLHEMVLSEDASSRIVGRTVIAGDEVAVGRDSMTDQCWKLLPYCANIFKQIRIP